MAFPLASISTGLSLLGGLKGLLSAGSERRRQEEAEAAAINELKQSGEQEFSDALGSGQRGLYGLRGLLNDMLQRGGRSLGAAEAGAGVYNSSATAGALANQESANAGTLGRYTSGLAGLLANIRNRTNQQVAQMKYGMAQNNLNFARQQQAGTAGGIASLLGNLGQLNMAGQGVNAFKPNNTGSVLPGPSSPFVGLPQQNELLARENWTSGMAMPRFNFEGIGGL